jgi:phage baseplate assembly protein gpV
MLGHNKRLERKLKEHGGSQAWATVLDSRKEWASTGGGNVSPGQAGSITIHQALKLRVEPDGEAPFEASVKQVFNDSHGWPIPQEGWSVAVIYDPNDHSKVVIDLEQMPVMPGADRDEAVARHERAMVWAQDPAAQRQQIEAMKADAVAKAQAAAGLQETVAAAFSAPQTGAPGANTVDQLTKLADLRDRGVLSDAQFEALKTKLIGTS